MKGVVYESRGFSREVPPSFDFVKIYFIQKGASELNAENFYKFYENKNWKTERGTTVKNWKALANEWIWSLKDNCSF